MNDAQNITKIILLGDSDSSACGNERTRAAASEQVVLFFSSVQLLRFSGFHSWPIRSNVNWSFLADQKAKHGGRHSLHIDLSTNKQTTD